MFGGVSHTFGIEQNHTSNNLFNRINMQNTQEEIKILSKNDIIQINITRIMRTPYKLEVVAHSAYRVDLNMEMPLVPPDQNANQAHSPT